MTTTLYTCGCVESDGVRHTAVCTEGHTELPAEVPEPEPLEDDDAESPDETRRIGKASAALARGEDPDDTRTPAEKKADKKASKA